MIKRNMCHENQYNMYKNKKRRWEHRRNFYLDKDATDFRTAIRINTNNKIYLRNIISSLFTRNKTKVNRKYTFFKNLYLRIQRRNISSKYICGNRMYATEASQQMYNLYICSKRKLLLVIWKTHEQKKHIQMSRLDRNCGERLQWSTNPHRARTSSCHKKRNST